MSVCQKQKLYFVKLIEYVYNKYLLMWSIVVLIEGIQILSCVINIRINDQLLVHC